MKNLILVVLDTVRRDFFNFNLDNSFNELKKDFVNFINCHSIYTTTCASHYTIFFGDYFNKSKNKNFPSQLSKQGFIKKSFCNGAIITGYPLKAFKESHIENNRPFRDEMVDDLAINTEFDYKKEMFGKNFEDYYGSADDENRNVPSKWRNYIYKNKQNKNFIFLHFWKAHYDYGINESLRDKIICKNYKMIGRELLRRLRNGELTESFVKKIYSQRINETINIYLKDLIKILKENRMYKKSLIIITADHGEGLGDIGEDYNEMVFNLYKKIFRLYCRLERRFTFLPRIKKRYYKWDFTTFYHNSDNEFQKQIPLLIKFPNNEYGGKIINRKVSLFDIIYTVNDFLDYSMDIKSNNGYSLYKLLNKGEYRNPKKREISQEDTRELEKRLKKLGYF